jgi:uncharacterized damage-inducible protein DinB
MDTLISEWKWARSLTVDLLKSVTPDDLSFVINESSGPLWKQFRHMGRVQENYLNAIESGQIGFGIEGCTHLLAPSKEELLDYLNALEQRFDLLLENVTPSTVIDWFGQPASLKSHITRMLMHETLHHGQLILYVRAIGKAFPESWRAWGE